MGDKIVKLRIPYYSQYLDVRDPYWQPRSCGIVCLAMVLSYYRKKIPALHAMALQGKRSGGYGRNGWKHDYLVKTARRYSLESVRSERMRDTSQILGSLDRNAPVIVSIEKSSLNQRRFHLIVLTGYYMKGRMVSGFLYHDPESLTRIGGRHLKADMKTFMKSWRKMAVFISDVEREGCESKAFTLPSRG